mgnify:CR=1 FL=1
MPMEPAFDILRETTKLALATVVTQVNAVDLHLALTTLERLITRVRLKRIPTLNLTQTSQQNIDNQEALK